MNQQLTTPHLDLPCHFLLTANIFLLGPQHGVDQIKIRLELCIFLILRGSIGDEKQLRG